MSSPRIFVTLSLTVFALVAAACGSDSSSETSQQSGDDAAAPDAGTTTPNDASAGDAANGRHDSDSDASDGAIVPAHVVSGQFHSCALMSDGDVYCWGGNQAGQLGITADSSAHPTPLKIAGLANVVEIAAGGSFNCARVTSGAVSCWGDNATNQLGHNGGTDAACATNFSGQPCNAAPTIVTDLTNVSELALGYQHACALTTGGVMCWGDNVGGQGGHATGSDPLCGGFCTATPTLINPAVASITDVGAGQQVSFVITSGNVLAFGSNGGGLLGGPAGGPTPTSNGAMNAIHIVTGALAQHSCATQTGNTAVCWGENSYGVISLTTNGAAASSPTAMPITNVTAIGVGTFFSCALRTGGSVQCWGLNDGGQLGHDPTSDPMQSGNPASITPTDVAGLTDAAEIGVGSAHVCVLTTTAQVKCWGHGEKGQNGSVTSQNGFAVAAIAFPPM